MSRHATAVLTVCGLALAILPHAGAQSLAPGNASAVPNLGPDGQAQYAKFVRAGPHRAFAIGPAGQFGWSEGRATGFLAILGAEYYCNSGSKTVCQAYALDDSVVYGSYAANEAASKTAIGRIRADTLRASYGDEVVDYQVAAPNTIHRGSAIGATPLTIPGAKRITTKYLAAQLASSAPPVLIEVTNYWADHYTLPNSVWMRGAGDDAGDLNKQVTELFASLLASVAPRQDAPVVIFCDSKLSWLSYNAALRAAEAGHLNVYWYRGGIEAWEAAGLPVVTSVISAQLW